MGILQDIMESNDKKICLEIGGGYGGLSNCLGSILSKKATCIVIDIPEILMFSGSFLILNNPGKSIYIYNKETFTSDFLKKEIYKYDYVLLPNYILDELKNINKIDLVINLQSFQEMSTK